jgi:hypothetical protein
MLKANKEMWEQKKIFEEQMKDVKSKLGDMIFQTKGNEGKTGANERMRSEKEGI